MSTIADIVRRATELRDGVTDEKVAPQTTAEEAEKRLWNDVMQQLREPFEMLSEAIDGGLEHAGSASRSYRGPGIRRRLRVASRQMLMGTLTSKRRLEPACQETVHFLLRLTERSRCSIQGKETS